MIELLDHAGAVARSDRRETGDGDFVARMRLPHRVHRMVQLFDHRQDLAGILVGHPARDHDRLLVLRDEAAHQMLGNDADILLERLDVVGMGFFGEPAPQGFQRPDIADASLFLDQLVNRGNDGKRLRRIQRFALGEFNQDVDRIGTCQFGVEATACRHRLLLVRNLIGQPITRLEVGINHRKAADHDQREQTEEPGMAHHPYRDPGTEAAQRLHA